MADNFIVAIELGSSKVTAVAGRKQPDGAIEILAFTQEPSTTFIRKGRINNVNKMTQCIISMKEKLEQKLQKSISRVYVGIGGMGMHTVANTIERRFDAKVEITQEMIDAMNDDNRATANSERDILEAVPQEYRLGTQQTTDPVGVLAESIEGHYLNIVANQSVREDIRNCFRNAQINIADLPITIQSLAESMLTEPEKRSGCVFVDMGAETTSVAIYKNNLLRHMAVIPLGGANINRDIMSLQIEDDEAEELKLKYGTAQSDPNEEVQHKPITLRDGRTVKYEDFIGLVEARAEEIILNVKNQIELSKYDKNQLIGGLIITGGASHLKDIDKAFMQETKFEKIRFVRNLRIQLRNSDYPGLNVNGECNAAIALIDKGEINCCGGDLGQPRELFTDEDEQKDAQAAQAAESAEEQARLAKEEEGKRLAEEQAREEEERLEKQRRKEEKEAARKAKQAKRKEIIKKVGNFFAGLVKESDE